MLREVAENLWIFDGPDVVFAGASMHTRMTIARLADGRLWLHSPVELNDESGQIIDSLGGEVAVLVAPNKFHHLYIGQWRERYPEAMVLAEAQLQQKISHLADAVTLTDQAPELYGDEIEQLVVRGNRLYIEVVFFHKASRTLIVTDLMINLPLDNIGFFAGLFLRFEGVVYPDGGIPRLYRWLTTDRQAAKACVEQIMRWNPQTITLCHGGIIEQDVPEFLARQFAWLN